MSPPGSYFPPISNFDASFTGTLPFDNAQGDFTIPTTGIYSVSATATVVIFEGSFEDDEVTLGLYNITTGTRVLVDEVKVAPILLPLPPPVPPPPLPTVYGQNVPFILTTILTASNIYDFQLRLTRARATLVEIVGSVSDVQLNVIPIIVPFPSPPPLLHTKMRL